VLVEDDGEAGVNREREREREHSHRERYTEEIEGCRQEKEG